MHSRVPRCVAAVHYLLPHSPQFQLPDNIFADLFSPSSDVADSESDELTIYLNTPCENVDDEHVLAWWRGQTQYPRLSRMAVSYLSCPGTSCVSVLALCFTDDFLIVTATSVDVERIEG